MTTGEERMQEEQMLNAYSYAATGIHKTDSPSRTGAHGCSNLTNPITNGARLANVTYYV